MNIPATRGLLVGLIATLSMDVASVLATRLGLIAPLSPRLVGRWFASVASAHPVHADIARVPAMGHEVAIALPVHYAIGLFLASVYVWASSQFGWQARSVAPPLAFGCFTCLLPWLVMFPAMGYGLFGSHGPEGTRLFVSSFATHVFFGLGLWVGARVAGLY